MPNDAVPEEIGPPDEPPGDAFQALGDPLLERARENTRRILKRVFDAIRDAGQESDKRPEDETEERPSLPGP